MKKIYALAAALVLTGCSRVPTYKDVPAPAKAASTLVPVSDTYGETVAYTDEGIPDACHGEWTSDDGICTIKKMDHYWDVTIDYENSTPAEAGQSYAKTIVAAFPDYAAVMEPYLYENIIAGFPALKDDYEPVRDRIYTLAESLRPEQREELYAFAETISGGVRGYAQDGVLSYDEALTFDLIPEGLRGTACSALSLWGSKTVSGEGLSLRLLDWQIGSENQMCTSHAVVHAKKGDRSYTGISFLGFNSIVSAVNDDGVFASILDVGSDDEPYSCEAKKCYTWELRYALEEYSTAEEVGTFMVENSSSFTWSHNIFVTDAVSSYAAEDAVQSLKAGGKGRAVLRGSDTPLLGGLTWDNEDSLCVVNSFAANGNQDFFSNNLHNTVRWYKYNEWVKSRDRFSAGDVKTMISREKVQQGMERGEALTRNVRVPGTVQIILVDYSTGNIQVSFTPVTGPDDNVIFTDVGHF